MRLIVIVFRSFISALLTLFWGGSSICISFFDDPYAKRAARNLRFWGRGILWTCGIKMQQRGRERLDPNRAYLFMANHQSNFDVPIIMAAVDTLQIRWVSKRAVRKVPVIGLCMQCTHQVFVDRDSPTQALAVIRQVKKLLNAGISVFFFPEGTRTRDGRLQAFKPGGFAVAVEAGVPVVPVSIRGSGALWPPGGLDIRPGTVEVIFGDPISVTPHVSKKAAREELLVKVREAIAAQLQEETSSLPSLVTPGLVPTSAPEPPTS